MEIEIKNPSEAEQASLADEYKKALAFSADESAEYSLSHYKKMSRIIGCRLKPSAGIRKKKTRLAALLIAAAVLLALVGCTAVVYREQIGEFFTEIYEDHIKGIFIEGKTENDGIINEVYTLNYVPDGYELAEEIVLKTFVQSTWETRDGAQIIFEQTEKNFGHYYMDNDLSTYSIIEIQQFTIYYRDINDICVCVWNNDRYAFTLRVNDNMNQDEILKIIENIKVK